MSRLAGSADTTRREAQSWVDMIANKERRKPRWWDAARDVMVTVLAEDGMDRRADWWRAQMGDPTPPTAHVAAALHRRLRQELAAAGLAEGEVDEVLASLSDAGPTVPADPAGAGQRVTAAVTAAAVAAVSMPGVAA